MPPWPQTEWSPAPFCGAFWAERSLWPRRRRADCLLGARWHQSCFPTIFQPIAFATDVDGRRVMEQPVQDRGRNNRIAKDGTPVGIAFVGSQDDAAAFVAGADQLKENRGS